MTELIGSKAVDFGKTSDDYAQFRPGFPRRFYERLGDVLARGKGEAAFKGVSVFDVATGPGVIAIELAALGAGVVGVDIAENQIAAARERVEKAGLADKCRFSVATAERTEQKDSSFDLVTAGQCWHWFDHKRTIPELWRILKPGGRLAIAHFDYLPSRSEIAAATEQLVLKHNPSWGMANMTGLYPGQVAQLLGDGQHTSRCRWEMEELFVFDHAQPFTRQGWRGRIRTCNGVGSGVLSPAQLAAFDRDLEAMLEKMAPKEPFTVFHRVWCLVVRKEEDEKEAAASI